MTDSITQIAAGEEKVFRKQNIILNADIECEGRLVFEDCELTVHPAETTGRILLGEKGELILQNCKVRYERSEDDPYPRHPLVQVSRGCGGTVVCRGTEFQDCRKFLETGEEAFVLFESCLILNPSGHFCRLGLKHNRLDMQNCTIRLSGSRPMLLSAFSAIFTGNTSRVENCLIEGSESTAMSVFQLCGAEFEGCQFTGITGCIGGAAVIRKCQFRKSRQVIGYLHDSETSARVSDCLFEQCEEVITNLPGQSTIANCRFTDCKDQIISNNDNLLQTGKSSDIRVESCRFSGLTGHGNAFTASLAFRRSMEGGGSVLKDCVFDGVSLTQGFLIAGSGEHALRVESCEFLNCVADNQAGGVIQTHYGPTGDQIESVVISNCSGFSPDGIERRFNESFAMSDADQCHAQIDFLLKKYSEKRESGCSNQP